MKLNAITLSTLLVLASAAGPAAAVDPLHQGAFAGPANRIAGLWTTDAAVSPCGTTLPPQPVRNTLLFAAGGSVVENPRIPPAGVPNAFGVPGNNQRGIGIGTWAYAGEDNIYTLHLRFDWYVDGVYNGYQTVDRNMHLSPDGAQITGSVQSTRYYANGSAIVSVCGAAISDRL